jgi:hypothetical protein
LNGDTVVMPAHPVRKMNKTNKNFGMFFKFIFISQYFFYVNIFYTS